MEEGGDGEEVGDSGPESLSSDGSGATDALPPRPTHQRGRSCPAAITLIHTSGSSSNLALLEATMEEDGQPDTPPSWSPALQVRGRCRRVSPLPHAAWLPADAAAGLRQPPTGACAAAAALLPNLARPGGCPGKGLGAAAALGPIAALRYMRPA